MTRYKRGDVLLLPFPFSDALAEKRRPAVVVSSGDYMASGIDIIVAMVTSRARMAPVVGDHRLNDWRAAGLVGPSTVRARLATVNGKRVIKRLGAVSKPDMAAIEDGLRSALQLHKK